MYFDTDILLKYSDPIAAGGSYFLWICHGLHQWKVKYLLNSLQRMNDGPDLRPLRPSDRKTGEGRKEYYYHLAMPKPEKPCCLFCVSAG